MLRVYTHLRRGGQTLLGPNCRGHQPRRRSVGIMLTQVFAPGRVASSAAAAPSPTRSPRSWRFSASARARSWGSAATRWSAARSFDVLERFEADPETDLAVMVGEIGGAEEEKAAEFISERMRTPVVGYIAGFQGAPRQADGPRGRDHHRLLGHGPGQEGRPRGPGRAGGHQPHRGGRDRTGCPPRPDRSGGLRARPRPRGRGLGGVGRARRPRRGAGPARAGIPRRLGRGLLGDRAADRGHGAPGRRARRRC